MKKRTSPPTIRRVVKAAATTGWSGLSHVRYRTRVVAYKLSYRNRPSAIATLEFILAVLGASSVFSLLSNLLGLDTPRHVWTLLASVALALAAASWHSSSRPSDVFVLAAMTEGGTERLRRDMMKGMRSEKAFDLLFSVYAPIIAAANDTLARDGVERPLETTRFRGEDALCVLLPAQGESLDDLLEPSVVARDGSWQRLVGSFAGERQVFVQKLRSLEGHKNSFGDDDGDNLVLDSIAILPGALRLAVSVAGYGDIMRTGDSLINEFALFGYLVENRDEGASTRKWPRVGRSTLALTPKATLTSLPWRNRIHSWAPDALSLLTRPSTRAAGLGVSVALMDDPSGYRVYVGRRSTRVGTYPGALHVVPSGMCNARQDLRRPGSTIPGSHIRYTMLGELLEECFDIEEASSYSISDWTARIAELLNLEGLSDISLEFTGVAIDLLNLRPEVCAVSRNFGSARRASRLNLCWEYDHLQQVATVDVLDCANAIDRTDYVQSGAASIDLARRFVLRQQ